MSTPPATCTARRTTAASAWADVAALHAGDGGSILLDVGGSVQGTANTSLTGGMDMLSAFNAAGYDLQAFNAADLAFGPERLIEDAMVTSGPLAGFFAAKRGRHAAVLPLHQLEPQPHHQRPAGGFAARGQDDRLLHAGQRGVLCPCAGRRERRRAVKNHERAGRGAAGQGRAGHRLHRRARLRCRRRGAGGPGRQRCAHQQPRRTDPHRARPAHPCRRAAVWRASPLCS